ncbi:hypothetical protein KJ966_10190 [bacterium]|nr:hypothetical protein [bacterium]
MAFKKGKSGNPDGRPPGALNKTTMMVQKLFADEAEEISRSVIKMAKDGDLQAAKLIIERICPAVKDAPVDLKLPKIRGAEDITKAFSTVNEAITAGQISPGQGKVIADILEAQRKALETLDLDRKLEQLKTIIEGKK